MNLALHGLSGDIRLANSYYDDLHDAVGRFDFVMANPPFNVNGIDKSKLEGDTRRFPFGLPRPDNGNYLWIQLFYSALNETGRAGFVMANSASDARASEAEIRRQLIEERAVDVMIAIGPNFFYTVTLPVTLWFLDRGKRGTPREDTVLFLDARHTSTGRSTAPTATSCPSRSSCSRTPCASIAARSRSRSRGARSCMAERFPDGAYADVPGFCKVATIAEIEAQGWSLNPGRYVGVAAGEEDDGDFASGSPSCTRSSRCCRTRRELLRRKVDAAVQGILEA